MGRKELGSTSAARAPPLGSTSRQHLGVPYLGSTSQWQEARVWRGYGGAEVRVCGEGMAHVGLALELGELGVDLLLVDVHLLLIFLGRDWLYGESRATLG